jgi:hypothetical protein
MYTHSSTEPSAQYQIYYWGGSSVEKKHTDLIEKKKKCLIKLVSEKRRSIDYYSNSISGVGE